MRHDIMTMVCALALATLVTSQLHAAPSYLIGVVVPEATDLEEKCPWYAQKEALELFKTLLYENGSPVRQLLMLRDDDDVPNIEFAFEKERLDSHRETDSWRGPEDRHSRIIAQKFAENPKVVAVIGHMYSREALNVCDIYERAKLVLISPKASNPLVTKGPNRRWIFSMMYDDEWQGSLIAAYMYKVMNYPGTEPGYHPRVAVIYQKGYEYSEALHRSFFEQIEKMGIDPPQTIDFENLQVFIDAFESQSSTDRIDAIALLGGTNIYRSVIKRLRARGINAPIVAPDALADLYHAKKVDEIMGELMDSLSPASFKSMDLRSSESVEGPRISGSRDPRVVVANPFFPELADLLVYSFKSRYREQNEEKWGTWLSEQSDVRGQLECDRYPSIAAMTYVDAAVLITRGIIQANKERVRGLKKPGESLSLATDARERLRSYLIGVGRQNAVNGFLGKIFFDENGASMKDVIFCWMRSGDFRPAFEQMMTVPEPHDQSTPVFHVRGNAMKLRHVVLTGMDFYRINYIDLVNQRFDIEVLVWFKWRGPDHLFETDLSARVLAEKCPIRFWNGVYGEEDQTVQLVRKKAVNGGSYVAFKMKGTFLAKYGLKLFPFDTQHIHLEMSLDQGSDVVLLAVDKSNLSRNEDFRHRIFPAEYIYKPPLEPLMHHASGTWRLGSTLGDPYDEAVTGESVEFSVYKATIKLGRDPTSYLVLMVLPLAILNLVSLAAFWVPVRNFEVRISLVLTALLSSLVFHLSRSGELPHVGYMTRADSMFVFAYVMMSVNIAVSLMIQWLLVKDRDLLATFTNSAGRYILSALTIIGYLSLVWPVVTGAYGILFACGAVLSIWLIGEFIRWNPKALERCKQILVVFWPRRTT